MAKQNGPRGLLEQRPREPTEHPFLESAMTVGPGDDEIGLLEFRNIQEL